MKYFLDTEFIEGFHESPTRRHHIDLISLSIIREDGKNLSVISKDYDYNDASDWVKTNVIKPLYLATVPEDKRYRKHSVMHHFSRLLNGLSAHNFHKKYGKSREEIKQALLDFFGCVLVPDGTFWRTERDQNIEIYGYYADYDWVLFCSLFGTMMDLPKGFPMYCRDLKQIVDELQISKEYIKKHVPDPENEHLAYNDALWNMKLYDAIQKY